MKRLKPDLRQSIFWDVDFKEIDYDKHARFIIERVLSRGNLKDWLELKSFYGLEKIKAAAVRIRSLDKLTLNFCHMFFNIKKEEFRCYNTIQSTRQVWDY